MSILAELYYDWHSPREKPREGEREEWARNEELWMEAEKALDAELFCELQQSVIRLIDSESCHEFQEGFRLGFELMMELRHPSAPKSAAPQGCLEAASRAQP